MGVIKGDTRSLDYSSCGSGGVGFLVGRGLLSCGGLRNMWDCLLHILKPSFSISPDPRTGTANFWKAAP